MRVTREDSTDLGFIMDCLMMSAAGVDDVSAWASKAIDDEVDPPVFLYSMLDLRGQYGKTLREEIGFIPGKPDLNEPDFQYLRQLGVRRHLKPYSYLGDRGEVLLSPERKKMLDELFLHNFGINVDQLPPLSAFAER